MTLQQKYQAAYDNLMDSKIEEFFNKYQRHPNESEEMQIESQLTEDEIREALETTIGYELND